MSDRHQSGPALGFCRALEQPVSSREPCWRETTFPDQPVRFAVQP